MHFSIARLHHSHRGQGVKIKWLRWVVRDVWLPRIRIDDHDVAFGNVDDRWSPVYPNDKEGKSDEDKDGDAEPRRVPSSFAANVGFRKGCRWVFLGFDVLVVGRDVDGDWLHGRNDGREDDQSVEKVEELRVPGEEGCCLAGHGTIKRLYTGLG